MRKNSPRKWVHAILDLLPLLVIPIFAIYSQRHVVDNNSVVVGGYETQLVYETNEVEIIDNAYNLHNGYIYKYDVVSLADFLYNSGVRILDANFVYYNEGQYPFMFEQYVVQVRGLANGLRILDNSNNNLLSISSGSLYIVFLNIESYNSQLNTYGVDVFSSDYLPIKEVYNDEIIYNDTDIGSQFIYQMYNVTDKYFNFNQLFNMGSVYDWLNTNMFGGNAPLIVPIVWNIIVYELFMDIIFLFYAVFMFIVDFATNMVDSFLHKSSKGRY